MHVLRIFAILVPLTVAATAWAEGKDIDVKISGVPPVMTVKVNKDLKSATLDIKSTGGGKTRKTLGPMAAGGELVFPLDHTKPGKVQWSGKLEVTFEDETGGAMPLNFASNMPVAFKFDVKDVKIAENSLTLVSEHETTKIDVEVYGEYDELLASQGFPQTNVKAGTPMTVTWDPKKANALVLRIHVVVTDALTATQSTDLFPYNISIPHEDVEFEFGKADIRASEEPKMTAALAEIEKASARYGTAIKLQGVQIRLFVGGHTDTKGSPAANQALSERRAVAIAKWFAAHNVKVGVYARGFGEDVLKVETPDETEEQKNRRVEYDVGVNGPTGSLGGWTKVK